MPPDRSTFAVGQRFDLRVEATGLPEGQADLTVLVNGTPVDQLPGATVVRGSSAAGAQEVTLRGLSFASPMDATITATAKYTGGQLDANSAFQVLPIAGSGSKAKNVILLIDDGMGAAHRTAARIVSKGVKFGKFNDLLEMDKMAYHGYVFTPALNNIWPDSAAAISAQAGGNKTDIGALSVWPDDTADTLDNPRYETIAEYLKRTTGKSVGLISTAYVADATPAGFLAHTYKRGDYSAIVDQYLSGGVDVLLGGGWKDFLPTALNGSRTDGRNQVDAFKAAGYTYVTTGAEMKAIPTNATKLLGLFTKSNMSVYVDQVDGRAKGPAAGAEPSLAEMTDAAIKVLSQNPNGFFLMIEDASTDKRAHVGDANRTVWETIGGDRALAVAKAFASQANDTLVIATADHETGGMAVRNLGGDPTSLELGWGSMSTKAAVVPVTTAPAKMGEGVAEPTYTDPIGMWGPNKDAESEHTATEIPLSASGPGSSQFAGPMDETEIFFKMLKAVGGGYTDPAKAGVPGDMNGDGALTIQDVVASLRKVAGL
jgi:alkaline phosphatase